MPDVLSRTLGLRHAVTLGLGSMVGAGVFVVMAPAAASAGSWLVAALLLAGFVAYANATSSARLAARYPAAGGTYVYGRERLGAVWGYLAGWQFVVGKTASCAAVALTVGLYAWPEHAHLVAVAAVLGVTAVDYLGVTKSAAFTAVLVAFVLTVLATVVVVSWTSAGTTPGPDAGHVTVRGVLQASGLLFFAFAGYARIATLGEEVRDPARTIPRAVLTALAMALGVYLLVAVAVQHALGPGVASSTRPLADAVTSAGHASLEPLVRTAAAVAALGSLLALVLGVSRTAFAMARDAHLPRGLAVVHPRFGVPHRAELAVGAVVAVLAGTTDLRGQVGFSSFAVLTYYAVANAAALTLPPRRWSHVLAVAGLAGCGLLALSLPTASVRLGLVSIAVALGAYAFSRSAASARAA